MGDPMITGPYYKIGPQSMSVGEMRIRVASYVGMPDSDEGILKAQWALENAARELNKREWYWSFSQHDFQFLADVNTGQFVNEYPLPQDYKSTKYGDALNSLDDMTVSVRFYYQEPDFFYQTQRKWRTRRDHAFTVVNEHDKNVITFPTEGFDWETYRWFRHFYVRRLFFTDNPGQTFPIPDEAESFLLWFAKAELASEWAPEQYMMAKQKSDETWRSLRADNKRRHHRDYIKVLRP